MYSMNDKAMNAHTPIPLLTLVELMKRAQKANSLEELAFLVVNETHALAPYRQGVLWWNDGGIHTLSGVVQIEANAPYALWLSKICSSLSHEESTKTIMKQDLPQALGAEWEEWLPAYGLWLPLRTREGRLQGALFLAREHAWQTDEVALVNEWLASWLHAWLAIKRNNVSSWSSIRHVISSHMNPTSSSSWWRRPTVYWLSALLLMLLMPVHLSVLAPSELVPSAPTLVRAPLDGVVGQFSVKPNEMVKAGQLLFSFDEATWLSKREVTKQGLATIQAEYRQQEQQALYDTKAKSMLAMTAGRIAEKQAELEYLEEQVSRLQVLAPSDGVAMFDDPSEWIGKPVQTGERIMRLADPTKVEIEAWIAVGDATPIKEGDSVSLYLNASPMSSISATVRYMAHEVVQRPDGSYAYRVRASLKKDSGHRVGLQGTARINGERVSLIYWITRRPLAVIRQTIGW
jgi:hypothetical protein